MSPRAAALVWVGLVAATCATGWIAETGYGTHAAVAAMLVIAAVKIALIMWFYMDVRVMPKAWQLAQFGWLAVVTCGVVANVWWPVL